MKKLILIILVAVMLTGCSNAVSYKYDEAISQNGDWSVESGQISVKNGEDLVNFKVKYIGDTLIKEGTSWTCKIMVGKNSKEIFSVLNIHSKEIAKGDVKDVSTEKDVIDIDNDYDFKSAYLQIKYSKNNTDCEDIIKVELKN